jgi:hypothetical protein
MGVKESALHPYDGPLPPPMYGAASSDDGLSPLASEDYLTIRLGDQLSYYQLKANRLETQLVRLRWLIYVTGGAGTLLAALGFDLWIPLTTSVMAALTTFLEYRQTAETLMRYSQAARDLDHVLHWWRALPPRMAVQQTHLETLVDRTEDILERELADWVSRMRDAIEELAGEQESQTMQKDGI